MTGLNYTLAREATGFSTPDLFRIRTQRRASGDAGAPVHRCVGRRRNLQLKEFVRRSSLLHSERRPRAAASSLFSECRAISPFQTGKRKEFPPPWWDHGI